MCVIRCLIGLTLVLASQLASAFMDAPVLVSTSPLAGEPVMISITAGGCDVITSDPIEVKRTGNNILMVVPTAHSDFSDFCIFPTGALTLEVGAFAPGTYSLRVDRSYIGDSGPVTALLGTLAFTVSTTARVPALSLPALLVLTLLFAATSAVFGWHERAP